MIELRVRNRIGADEMAEKVGKVLAANDINVLLTGPTLVRKPEGDVLLVYLPGVIPPELRDQAYPVLSELSRQAITANRGIASGSKRVKTSGEGRTDAKRVHSIIVGAFDRLGARNYCRLSSWTGREVEKMAQIQPLLQFIGDQLAETLPERHAAQMSAIDATERSWVIPETPFTTVTVNNTYETGVHKDKGDLDEGFSTLAVIRRGDFKGGWLCFPEYRVGVDMQDGDLILMDAHEWHGNTWLDPRPEYNFYGTRLDGWDHFERISVVSYYRTKMQECGTPLAEAERMVAYANRRNAKIEMLSEEEALQMVAQREAEQIATGE